MELTFSKKEYNEFINSLHLYIDNLEEKIKKGNPSFKIDFSFESIEKVEKYFSDIHIMTTEDIKEFWAYFGETLRYYVGGEYKLAPKSEDVAFTPILINYGFKDRWKVRISPEVWRDKLERKKLNTSILDNVSSLNSKYGKE
ncbi:hypothetical protein [Sphingobacterium luzhongxinii]|uniref:hypothetical protein n=1 Tax=Sphingobacterium luzhongxinii TaxID=2654181 RepID=UPI0013DC89C7|nr:hypothetical protein [Sphingobacterium sp. xlx-73]